MAVDPPRRPGREITGPTGGARPPASFSLRPAGGSEIGPVQRGGAPARVAAAGLPRRVFERLKTAISDADIDAQIDRMLRFITMGLIDRTAPRGSYLNLLT
ncbi:MAG: hypothetical protein HYR63_22495 [Proteobacteria bacterium]|nr:hypothetical protein [Pseudomonadota bacterium]MBI3497619.1 hypothetical protein [Pseudomonadota bacterium]